MRASLEVTDHPRTVELSNALLPWLDHLGIGDELDPIERELLATPYGQLQDAQRTDVNWAGEGAAIFGWAIGISDMPPRSEIADHNATVQKLLILRPEARIIVENASARPVHELVSYCKEVAAIRWQLRELRVRSTHANLLQQVFKQQMADIGLEVTQRDVELARATVETMTPEIRDRGAGWYSARDHAATWLFDSRATYFA